MTDVEEFTTETARSAARDEQLEAWVARFLASPGSDNAELGRQLVDRHLSWLGPVQLRLDELARLAGPPGAPVLEVVDDDDWRDDVDDLAARIEAGTEPAPVVATYGDDQLVLEDGNHRVEALRRAGRDTTWGVVGFDTTEARDRFVERSASD